MDKLDEAFQTINRSDFLRSETREGADTDRPIPIGYGQSNSQPTTVKMMLKWLEPKENEKILDIGSGSGWTSSLLAYMVGPQGEILAVEKIPELVKFGRDNCANAGIKNVSFFEAVPTLGLPDYAPYDRILVSATTDELPKELIVQLKIGGRLVIPVNESVFVVDKTGDASFDTKEHYGFSFVPLV